MVFKLKMVKKVVLGIFSSTVLLFMGCDNEPMQKETVEPEPKTVTKPRIKAPSFNEDSAYLFTKIQVDFGPRVPESKAHAKAAEWFQKQLKAYGAKVILQTGLGKTFDGKQYGIKNIIASFNDSAKERILLCTHWDSRPFADKDSIDKNKAIDGANDGASGVAVLMEIARLIKNNPPNVGIDIILFDLEDYGRGEVEGYEGNEDTWCLGSKYWAENKHQAAYNARFGILLDMVGGFNPSFPKEGYSLYYANGVVDKVWEAAKNLGYAAIFKDNTSSTITDDHVNINKIAGIPCIDILNYDENLRDFNAHHHKHSDNLKNIDKKTLAIVGQVVLDVIYNE
jgi:glutaminyl-peptide cyclotransferase